MPFQNCKIAGRGVDPRQYHSAALQFARGDKGYVISPSTLKLIGHCPSRWKAGFTPKDTDAMKWGSLLDTLVLTPDLFATRYAVQPESYKDTVMECPQCHSRTKAQKCAACKCERMPVEIDHEWTAQATVCQEWAAQQEKAGKEIVWLKLLDDCTRAKNRLLDYPTAAKVLKDCHFQTHVTGEWLDSDTGVIIPCQCLIDLEPKDGTFYSDSLADLKSTRSAYPPVWRRYSRDMRYNVQAGFDLDMYNAAMQAEGKEPRENWIFLLSENYEPFEPGCELLESADPAQGKPSKLNLGRLIYKAWLGMYARCLATGKWGGYQDNKEARDLGGFSLDAAESWDYVEASKLIDATASEVKAEMPDDDTPPDGGEIAPDENGIVDTEN